MTMVDVTRDGTRLEQLKELAILLAEQLDAKDMEHSPAQLARQYRETIQEISFLEDSTDGESELDGLLDG